MINQAGSYRAIKSLKHLLDSQEARRVVSEMAIQTEEHRAASPSELHELDDPFRSHVESVVALFEADKLIHNVMELEGALRFDTIGLRHLDTLGSYGRAAASQLRPEAQSRWTATTRMDRDHETEKWIWWCDSEDEHARFPVLLARVLWRDALGKVRPEISDVSSPGKTEKEAKETVKDLPPTKYPVISATVLRAAIGGYFSKAPALKSSGHELLVVNKRGDKLATISSEAAADPVKVKAAVASTRTVLGHRLFRFLVSSGVHLSALVKNHAHRVLPIEGGLKALAGLLGYSGSKAATSLREVLDGFRYMELDLPNQRREALINWTLEGAGPGTQARLRIVFHDALLPDYVNGFPKTTPQDREAKRLVPVPQVLPPLYGGPRSHAAQALLQLLVMEELRAQAESVSRHGFAWIPLTRWHALANEAGVPEAQLLKVLETWVTSPESFLEQCSDDPDYFALAKGYAADTAALVGAGQKSSEGRARQALTKKKVARKA